MLPGVLDAMNELAKEQPRFKLLSGLTKEEYYIELSTCRVQFNSSLQDYVSWTVIESTMFGADIVFPDFRSFPEFIDQDRLYKPFDLQSAVDTLETAIANPRRHFDISETSDLGRKMEGYIIARDYDKEINVWHEKEYCEELLYQDFDNRMKKRTPQLELF
jgi:hypothetical protein